MTSHAEPWATGAPAWADIAVADLGAARRFYAAVLGWTFEEVPATGDGTHLVALVRGHRAAGLRDAASGTGDRAPAWTVYLATDDVVGTVEAAVRSGGTLVVPPEDTGTGLVAVLEDPSGAVVGVRSAGTAGGAEVVEEPGAMAWWEMMSGDYDAACDFYVGVFGWTLTDMSAPGFTYATFEVEGRTAGGIGRLSPGSGTSPHWLLYFAVEDTDVALDAVRSHGGTVIREPWDSTFGRIALVAGPAGERFALQAPLATEIVGSRVAGDPA